MTALRRRGCPAWLESFAWFCAVAAGFGLGSLRRQTAGEIEAAHCRRLTVAVDQANDRCTRCVIGIGEAIVEYRGGRLD